MFEGFARWIGFVTMFIGVVGSLLLAAGFIWFAWTIPGEDVSRTARPTASWC